MELRSFEGALESLVEISLVFPVHPSEGLLEEYAFGRLIGSRLNAVEEHLLLCEGCQQACEETEQYIRLMQSAARRLVLEPHSGMLERVWSTVVLKTVRVGIPTRAWVWAGVLASRMHCGERLAYEPIPGPGGARAARIVPRGRRCPRRWGCRDEFRTRAAAA